MGHHTSTTTSKPNRAAGGFIADEGLAEVLDRHTRPATLVRNEYGKIRCLACGHRCLLGPGRRGVCKVRFNRDGELLAPHGYVTGLAVDPIEKKPFFHFLPGTDALTFGMLGCDFHCAYCQNWLTSQALRDKDATGRVQVTTPEQLVAAAHRSGARALVSSYNEPLITAEWATEVFEVASRAGLACAFVSNGNATPEALDLLEPRLTAYKVDLKTFQDQQYRRLGGALANVRRTIEDVHRRGIWIEVVTLLVPGFNNDAGELRELTAFLAGIDRDIPWHVTAFHPDYRMTEPRATRGTDLIAAAEIGAEAGLRHVYAGNRPGGTGEWENTKCSQCRETLIERRGFQALSNRIGPDGCCPSCRASVPGRWSAPTSTNPEAAFS